MTHHSHIAGGRLDYGFHGSKFVHGLALAGLGLVGAAAYALWGAGLAETWPIILAVIAFHFGAVLLIGAGAVSWVSRVGRYILQDRMLARVPLRGNETILDVGCGAGPLLVAAAKRLPDGKAVGIDMWTGDHGQSFGADTARANAETEGVADRVEVHNGDARRMTFADDSFDAVFCNFVLHHIDDRDAALREMVRVLKPGGRLVIADVKFMADNERVLTDAGAAEVRREPALRWIGVLQWLTARGPGA